MRSTLCLPVLALLATAPAASAQDSRFFRNLGLTPDEMIQAGTAAESLFAKSGVRPGNSASWQSETSEATGEVEVLDVTDGGRCVTFVHRVQARPDAREQPLELRRCRDDSGQWVLSP